MSDASSEVDDYSYNVYGQWFQVGQNIHPGWITGDVQDRRDERDFRYQYSENRWKRAPWSDPPRESAREWKSFSHDIDLKRIKRWYDLCRKTHGDYCNDRYSAALEQHFDKFHLVDVNKQCLVTLASSTPYVALSYVWGKNFRRKNPHYTMLSKNNVEALKKPGALSSGDSARLPATIRDAMKLVKELDMEYLIYVDEDESSDWTIAAPLQSVATYELPRNQKIFNGFYQFQAMRQDPDLPIPAGWERHRNDKEHFYTHPSTGGHENKYAYPLPAAGPGEPDLSKVNTNILSCTAEVVRAVFTAVPSIHNEYILARIRTSRPLHRTQCKASFVIPTASQPQLRPPNAKLLLVAISLADIGDHDRAYTWLLSRFVPPKNHDGNGTVPENPATSRSDQEARLTPESRAWLADLQSYYNVLWVETSHGIAYRKGLGMIKKQEWDALGAEVTKLKMG
ncbi:hypothetical protein E8E12_004465 [Didymella heteroderae]|uniref:Heterokaryon incompatibility domain-containing protein n=1 Tax=Didymella heteroderae TaxID=1769908 RepID=A0A9P4WL63_9PLEO|nr:hypothetical protein E8E12_004465 [Didymella heteroderae]